jgi:hypothetical protein
MVDRAEPWFRRAAAMRYCAHYSRAEDRLAHEPRLPMRRGYTEKVHPRPGVCSGFLLVAPREEEGNCSCPWIVM